MRRGDLLWLVAGGLAVMSTPRSAGAGDCYARARTYYYAAPSYSYYTPTYYTPSYTAPSYQAPCYETKVKAVPYPTTPDYYSSVSDYYRDKLLVDALAGRTAEVLKAQAAEQRKEDELRALKQEVEFLRQRAYQQPPPGPAPPPVQPPPQPPPQPKQEAPPRKEEPPPKKRNGARLPAASDKLKTSVRTSCLRCHGDNFASAGDGLDFRNLDALDRETRLAMYAAVNTGHMPKGARPLPDEIVPEYAEFATGLKLAQK